MNLKAFFALFFFTTSSLMTAADSPVVADSPMQAIPGDFKLADGYVAAMKGVILQVFPEARIVDISHEIAPQDVVGGAFVLGSAAPWFPRGTVHVAVVDPGVGSHRRALSLRDEPPRHHESEGSAT